MIYFYFTACHYLVTNSSHAINRDAPYMHLTELHAKATCIPCFHDLTAHGAYVYEVREYEHAMET